MYSLKWLIFRKPYGWNLPLQLGYKVAMLTVVIYFLRRKDLFYSRNLVTRLVPLGIVYILLLDKKQIIAKSYLEVL